MSRPRKLTAAESITRYEHERAQASMCLRALQDVVTGAVDATERTSQPCGYGALYTFQLTRAASPCGGLVVITFHCPGQKDSVTVREAEEMLRSEAIAQQWPAECWPALERLAIARNGALYLPPTKEV